MRVLSVCLLGVVLEIGWLAMWPLTAALSHSAAFTSALVAAYPLAGQVLGVTREAMRAIVPGLSDSPLIDPPGSPVYLTPAYALAAIMLWLAAAYLLALLVLVRGASNPRATLGIVVGAAVVFQATLAYLPGLFSQDVFSYVAYGRLAAVYTLNPYVWPPSVIPRDAVVPWVAEIWRTYGAPYGPVWLDVQWLMARASGEASVFEQAMGYRMLANALLLANLGLAWVALARFTHLDRVQRTTALATLAWNPLVLLEVAGNAHNDVLMVTFSLVGALVFARSRNGVLAGLGFTFGALVKYLSGVGVIWVGLASAARAGSWTERLLRLALVGIISLAVSAAVAWPWLELPDSLEPILSETVGVGYVNALPDNLALVMADRVLARGGMAPAAAREAARGAERLLVLAIFAIYVLWEARRVWSEANAAAVLRASARSCLMYVLLVSTSVQPWYFYLPLALAVFAGAGAVLTQVVVGYSLLALPALYLSYYLRDATPFGVNVVYGLAPLTPVLRGWFLGRRKRTGPPEPAALAERERKTDGRAKRYGVVR